MFKVLIGGTIINKKNYNPDKHKDSYTLNVNKKKEVFPWSLKQIFTSF